MLPLCFNNWHWNSDILRKVHLLEQIKIMNENSRWDSEIRVRYFLGNIVVINCTSLPIFLIITFKINTTYDFSIINVYKLSCISWRLLPDLLLISIPLRHLLSADSSHRRSCYRQMSAADVTPGTAASHHTLAVFGRTTSVVSCALTLAVISDWRIQLWGTTCKCVYLCHRRSQL
jgi:hypothetical protein